MWPAKTRCSTAQHCAASWASTWGASACSDATTLLKFRRLLQAHKLGEALFAKVGEVRRAHGMKVGTGTIVDASIIGAPSSTKNADRKRDPRSEEHWMAEIDGLFSVSLGGSYLPH
jgi:hypothetical protein